MDTVYYIIISSVSVLVVIAICILAYSIFQTRFFGLVYSFDEEEGDGECESFLGTCQLKKTSTFYQWNQMPPSSCCSMSVASLQQNQQQGGVTSEDEEDYLAHEEDIEKSRRLSSCWEQRRSLILKKYAATDNNETIYIGCNIE